jgi:tRNA pseudouridine38/39 synthase
MAVLFAVARGYEEPDVILQLFDTEKYPARPAYQIADDFPLILYDCHYPQLQFNYTDVQSTARVYDHFRRLFEKRLIESNLLGTCMAYLTQRCD